MLGMLRLKFRFSGWGTITILCGSLGKFLWTRLLVYFKHRTQAKWKYWFVMNIRLTYIFVFARLSFFSSHLIRPSSPKTANNKEIVDKFMISYWPIVDWKSISKNVLATWCKHEKAVGVHLSHRSKIENEKRFGGMTGHVLTQSKKCLHILHLWRKTSQ